MVSIIWGDESVLVARHSYRKVLLSVDCDKLLAQSLILRSKILYNAVSMIRGDDKMYPMSHAPYELSSNPFHRLWGEYINRLSIFSSYYKKVRCYIKNQVDNYHWCDSSSMD